MAVRRLAVGSTVVALLGTGNVAKPPGAKGKSWASYYQVSGCDAPGGVNGRHMSSSTLQLLTLASLPRARAGTHRAARRAHLLRRGLLSLRLHQRGARQNCERPSCCGALAHDVVDRAHLPSTQQAQQLQDVSNKAGARRRGAAGRR